jgi:hypothetical protein
MICWCMQRVAGSSCMLSAKPAVASLFRSESHIRLRKHRAVCVKSPSTWLSEVLQRSFFAADNCSIRAWGDLSYEYSAEPVMNSS